MTFLKWLTLPILASVLAACAVPNPETDEAVNLGSFRMVSNIAVTDNAKRMGVTREATPEEWEQVLEEAVNARFSRYDGDTPYIISYSLDGYILATSGGRLALAPRSALSTTVHIWQTDPQKRLEDRSKSLLVLEQLDGETFIGSGLFRTKEQQMKNLGAQFAKAMERWLVANSDLFGVKVSDEAKAAAKKDDLAALQEKAQAEREAAEAPADN